MSTSTPMHDTPAATGQGAARERLLLEFLRDHDADCPLCRYNLRGLTRPVCPECRQQLVLTVGVQRLRLGLLLLALVPGIFAGIFACLLAIPTTAIFFEDGVLLPPLAGGALFGWTSGAFAAILGFRARNRIRFLTQPHQRQRRIVTAIWAVHFLAAVLFFIGFTAYI